MTKNALLICLLLSGFIPSAARAADCDLACAQQQGGAVEVLDDASAKEVTDEIVARAADEKGWCDQPTPSSDGEIIVYWTRDSAGRCIRANVK